MHIHIYNHIFCSEYTLSIINEKPPEWGLFRIHCHSKKLFRSIQNFIPAMPQTVSDDGLLAFDRSPDSCCSAAAADKRALMYRRLLYRRGAYRMTRIL